MCRTVYWVPGAGYIPGTYTGIAALAIKSLKAVKRSINTVLNVKIGPA
jgi:hypothetical protein